MNKKQSNYENLLFVILAGGKGSRLKTDYPKPAVEILGKPLIQYVFESIESYDLDSRVIILSSSYNKKYIDKILNTNLNYEFCINEIPMGTADALKHVMKNATINENYIVVLLADRPLIKSKTISNLVDVHIKEKSKISMLTTKVPNFRGIYSSLYNDGRIIRNENGDIIANFENNELSEKELEEIKEVIPSTYIYEKSWLRDAIDQIKVNPVKNEYYLTQLVNIANKQGYKISEVFCDPFQTHGVNTLEDLKKVEKLITRGY